MGRFGSGVGVQRAPSITAGLTGGTADGCVHARAHAGRGDCGAAGSGVAQGPGSSVPNRSRLRLDGVSGGAIASVRRSPGERVTLLLAMALPWIGGGWSFATGAATGILAGIAAATVAMFWHHLAWKHARADLRRHRWLRCPACRQPLDFRLAGGVCPECGRPWRRAAVRRAWRRRYAVYLGDPLRLPPGA